MPDVDLCSHCQNPRKVAPKTGQSVSTNTRIRGRALQAIRTRHRRANPFCEHCQTQGRYRPWTQLDHIVPIDAGGKDDDDNRQGLCDECHDAKTRDDMGYLPPKPTIGADGWPTTAPTAPMRRRLSPEAEARRFPQDLPRSRIPITIVCGPPGSGKSTYVRQHAADHDLVIDLDAILSRMSGLPEHSVMTRWIGAALNERNSQLRALSTDTTHAHAWFIIAAPIPFERVRWVAMLGAKLVLLDVPADECKRRISADTAPRDGYHTRIAAVDAWWQHNGVRIKTTRRDDAEPTVAGLSLGGWSK